MAKLTQKGGKTVDYTPIPNRLIRSLALDAYDKAIYCCIASFEPSFPSYAKLMAMCRIGSKQRITKSLKALEIHGAIRRFKLGRKIYYETHWNGSPEIPDEAQLVSYGNRNGSPRELQSVPQGGTNKNKEKEQPISDAHALESGFGTAEEIGLLIESELNRPGAVA